MTRASGDRFDAVVVGSGPNGLVAANLLADGGRSVLVLEAADVAGGGCRTEELTLPGFRHDVCSAAHPMATLSPAMAAMDLPGLGVRLLHGAAEYAHPLDGEPSVLAYRDVGRTAEGLGDGGRAWQRLMAPFVRGGEDLVGTLLDPLAVPKAPFSLARYGATGVLSATALGRALGSDRARALLGGLAAHSMNDLHKPLTAGIGAFLGGLAHLGGWPVVEGGSQALTDALVARLVGLGGEVRTGVRVTSLAELPPARRVLLDLAPAGALTVMGAEAPPAYRDRLLAYRYGPGVFKVDWALDGPVPWADPRTAEAPTVHLGGSLAEVAATEAEVARGGHPQRPYVLLVQPTVVDPTRAPAGQHTVWAYCHVPNGSTVDRTGAIEAQVERFAPGFRDRVLARATMDTVAMQAHDANYVGGDIGAGAVDLRQFLLRPSPSLRPWRTAVPGVYLCSASTPPGPGVHGMSGAAAVRTLIADERRGRHVRPANPPR